MNERTTLEIIAPTVEEALAQGLAQLNLTADKVSVEVLDAGNKGLFGLGRTQVRVRLTVIPEGGAPAPQTEPAVPTKEAKLSDRIQNKPPRQSKPKPSPALAPGASGDQRFDELSAATQGKLASVASEEAHPEHDALLNHTETVISKLIHLLNLEAQVSAHYGDQDREGRRDIHVDIRGKDLSVLIGRHSETLNAFQYVASLVVGRELQDWVQLVVDVEGYRNRREKQLMQMAQRMADQVTKSGRRQSLEPMPAVERRIIHIALREHPNVKTESTGEEPHRKITILPKDG